jgi:wobble nucleotide-excising tRNase
MIESITISSVATYGNEPEVLDELSQFNFLFGSNGTGKTSVSRVIADEVCFPKCKVTWKGGTKLQPMVYNRDFVDRNFNQSTELKGVFTLGETQADTLTKIAETKADLDTLTKKIENLTQSLEGVDGTLGKKAELVALEARLKDKCWAQKQKYDAKLKGAFEGYRNSTEKFKGKVLQEIESNTSALATLAELEKKAESIFGPTPIVEQLVLRIDSTTILALETSPILKKRVIGKEDVDIAAMIKKLGNSDWVREGRSFYDANDSTCPFCQQNAPVSFAQNLNEYFDETFITDTKAIEDLAIDYVTDAYRIQQQLATIIAVPSKFLDVKSLKLEKEILDSIIAINNQRFAEKKKESSKVVELESLKNIFSTISSLIESANTQVAEHNKMVANLSKEQSGLTSQVWKFVLEEIKVDLAAYKTARNSLDKAIDAMTEQIKTATGEKIVKAAEIRDLEKQTTSIQPTIDGINSLLSSFGFQGFSLSKTANGSTYKLIRNDGSDAKLTLSEGEKTFITFFYFYHMLKGSDSDSGMTTDRIVVFDDPVSSLDSDILFIVGSLIKELFDEVRSGIGHIKQVFVLTHNVYFYKEVTFNPNRRCDAAMREETFWIVRKPANVSKIEKHPSNPIKTSYELLWSEVRKPDRSNLTIQNTLRRILENYFKILGGIDPDKICRLFEGKERVICKSLFSWVNDGSHSAHDDLYVSIDGSMIDSYLKVFRDIFEKTTHLSHYKMMMGDSFSAE